jgi:hypothetical protein
MQANQTFFKVAALATAIIGAAYFLKQIFRPKQAVTIERQEVLSIVKTR